MPTLPSQFDSTPVIQLLAEAERGLIGLDQRLMGSLAARPEETLAAMEAMLAGEREEALLDLSEQYFDLYRHFRSAEALPFYIDLLRKREGGIPDPLMEAFTDLGAPAVEPVLELVAESQDDDKADLVFLLSVLGTHDDRILSLIEETLARDPYEGALCAGLYHDPALKDTLARIAESTEPGSEDRKVLDQCLAALEQEPAPHEPSGFNILDIYPAVALPLFDSILPEDVVSYFDSEDAGYRARAAASFSDDDYSDEVRDRLLQLAAGDADGSVRGAAWRALGERVEEEDTRARLIDALENRRQDSQEWGGVLIGLSGATSEPEVHEALLEGYEGPATRAAALQAMWRSLDPRYRKYFGPNLRNEDDEIRRQAIQGVGAFPIPELALELVPLFKDEKVREDALFAYALSVQHNTTPKSAGKLLDLIDDRADGLDDSEQEIVMAAIDRRLEREGYQPVFFDDHDHNEEESEALTAPAVSEKIGRNEPCPCGSGKKYKKCCGAPAS